MSENSKNITRRTFVKSGVVSGAGIAAAGLSQVTAQQATATPTPEAATLTPGPREIRPVPEEWDVETEVLVVGYGGAGAAAAIAAAEAGAKVLVIEKQAEDGHTSNTQMCAGVFISPDTEEDARAFLEVASRTNPDLPESKDVDDATLDAAAKGLTENLAWVERLGALGFNTYAAQGRDDTVEGNEAIKGYQIQKEDGTSGVGVELFELLDAKVKELEVEVQWETPGKALITNEKGEVIGAWADTADGEVSIKASKAVILTTGGFEFDEAAVRTYIPIHPVTFYGNPDNTGDGMRMAQAVGADLWHMTVLGGNLKAKFDDFPTAFLMSYGLVGYMIVDKTGRRYINEAKLGGYAGYWNTISADTSGFPRFARIPSYWIFGQDRIDAGPLPFTSFGAAGPVGMYEWSEDNSVEIEKGWILKGETVEELAAALEVDPDALQEEFDGYAGAVEAGLDTTFGRDPMTLKPIEPPYYAVKMLPGMNNTFGGPRRNANCQVLDVFGQAIPRLYSAGELGSYFVQYPQGGANVGECFATGRIAGEQAAALDDWGAKD